MDLDPELQFLEYALNHQDFPNNPEVGFVLSTTSTSVSNQKIIGADADDLQSLREHLGYVPYIPLGVAFISPDFKNIYRDFLADSSFDQLTKDSIVSSFSHLFEGSIEEIQNFYDNVFLKKLFDNFNILADTVYVVSPSTTTSSIYTEIITLEK
jgi:hypothetical protein